MDVVLQNHRAKHICDLPDGLPELLADISREVIRSQPDDIYCFIADYLETLLITRENAKVAIRLVQNITLKSEHVVEILLGTGLRLEEIAAVAPRLQRAFKIYLDAVDDQKKECGCNADSDEFDDGNEISICEILKATGVSYPCAQRAAIKIQALFRGHHARMNLAECRGEVQWQRAAAVTVAILRKSGATRAEATNAAIIIQAAYRGYYTRKNLNITYARDGKKTKEQLDMCAWLRNMFEECGITPQRANQAATTIQVAWRRYQKIKLKQDQASLLRTSKSNVGEWTKKLDTILEGASIQESDNQFKLASRSATVKSMKSEMKSEGKSMSDLAHFIKPEIKTDIKSEMEFAMNEDHPEHEAKTKTQLLEHQVLAQEATETRKELETDEVEVATTEMKQEVPKTSASTTQIKQEVPETSASTTEIKQEVPETTEVEASASEIKQEIPETSSVGATQSVDQVEGDDNKAEESVVEQAENENKDAEVPKNEEQAE